MNSMLLKPLLQGRRKAAGIEARSRPPYKTPHTSTQQWGHAGYAEEENISEALCVRGSVPSDFPKYRFLLTSWPPSPTAPRKGAAITNLNIAGRKTEAHRG